MTWTVALPDLGHGVETAGWDGTALTGPPWLLDLADADASVEATVTGPWYPIRTDEVGAWIWLQNFGTLTSGTPPDVPEEPLPPGAVG